MLTDADSWSRERIVIDASVALAFLAEDEEEITGLSDRLSRAHLSAPSLLPFEVTNVLRRKRSAGLLSGENAERLVRAFWDIPIDLWPWQELAERVWELGDNLTSYDASYVALAELTNATLVTADARLAAAPGLRCPVHLLG